jgi:hypothetical protein
MIVTIPPMSIHIALSVGEPVKNREMSELNDFVAATPEITRTIPPARIASEIILFIEFSFKFSCLITKWSQGFSSANDSKQDDHDGDYQKNVNETVHGVGSHQPQKPQYNQNNSDGVKHNNPTFLFLGLMFTAHGQAA